MVARHRPIRPRPDELIMFRASIIFSLGALVVAGGAQAQTAAIPDPRNLTSVWEPMRTGRGADQRLAPPPPSSIELTPLYANAWLARKAAQEEATRKGEPLATGGSQCIPYGMPTMMSIATYPMEVLQTPGQVTIIGEAFTEVRRIYLDRPPMKIEEVPPGYYGRSVGKWEGDTLAIETVGIATNVNGYQGLPHTNQLRITERMRLLAPDVLHDQITLDDPAVLQKPVTYTLAYRRLPKYEMVEFVCDNNREYVDEKGVIRMKLPEK